MAVKLILLISSFYQVCGQNTSIDSLESLLKTTNNDSIKAIAECSLCDEYSTSDITKSITHGNAGLAIAEQVESSYLRAVCLNNLSQPYRLDGKREKALSLLLEALDLLENLDYNNEIASVLNRIGANYMDADNLKRALEYFIMAYEVHNEEGDQKGMASTLNNIGAIHYYNEDLDSAIYYFEKSMELESAIGNRWGVAASHNNIGGLYLMQEDYENAEKHFLLSLEIRKEIGDPAMLSSTYKNLGEMYTRMSKFSQAGEYLQLALELAFKCDNIQRIVGAYDSMSWLYSKQGDYETAYNYRILYDDYVDSLNDEESNRAFAEMATKYETEKMDAENELLKQQAFADEAIRSRQTVVIWSGAGGLLLVLLVAFQLFRSNKLKQRTNEQISRQKDEIEQKNQDITDSITYAQRIQFTILPDVADIEQAISNSFVFYEPRDVVSGDFFFFHEKADKIFLAACDCTGHGVPGAFVSITCSNWLKRHIIDNDLNNPGEILNAVNEGVQESFRSSSSFQAMDGMDMALICIDKNTEMIHYAGAMNDLVVVSNNELIEYKADRRPIGGRTEIDFRFNTQSISVNKGDCVYIYSDGYADQFGGPKGKKFMSRRFKELLVQIAHEIAEQKVIKLKTTLEEWQGDLERVDDVLIMGYAV